MSKIYVRNGHNGSKFKKFAGKTTPQALFFHYQQLVIINTSAAPAASPHECRTHNISQIINCPFHDTATFFIHINLSSQKTQFILYLIQKPARKCPDKILRSSVSVRVMYWHLLSLYILMLFKFIICYIYNISYTLYLFQ